MSIRKHELPIPRVFISYSWTSPEHEDWVLDLAERLMQDRVHVTLDKWDLQPGHDTYHFMESMVRSDKIDKVLIICDKEYYEKAEDRRGGVGTETLIISPEVYADIKQEKFIPIVAERDESGKPYIPTYIRSRMYIDLSSEEQFEIGYQQLLRNLYQRPQHRKPSLGEAPSWLFEDEPPHFKTANINKQLRDAITRNPARIRGLVREFIGSFFTSLDELQIVKLEEPHDQQIMDKIDDMLPLRDDYVEFIELLCDSQEELNIDPLVKFFEEIYRFSQPPEEVNSYIEYQYDHYKFLIQELFIYTVAILIENEQYKAVGDFLRTEFFIHDRFERKSHANYKVFYFHLRSLEEVRKHRLGLRLLSIAADTVVKRATLKRYPKKKIVNADLLLHYIAVLEEHEWAWFPKLYVYSDTYQKIDLLLKLKSRRYFEKVKGLFGVTQPDELKAILSKYEQPEGYKYRDSFDSVPSLLWHIKPEELCTFN
ncbi:TIR domain-containing protein [Brevibacillus borstelensis]|uniref:toll/interleukin-1 receptor domain-containing protein n=1 Tax=Brevibacillus borstelensis TaxID=45462 RepID=UPI0030D549EF